MRKRHDHLGDDLKKLAALRFAGSILRDVGREVSREFSKSSGRRDYQVPPPPPVNMPRDDFYAGPPYERKGAAEPKREPQARAQTNTRVKVQGSPRVNPDTPRKKTKANTDGLIAVAIICVFIFANVIVNMLDLVISGAVALGLIAALIAAVVFFGKFISKKSKERKEKKAKKEAERLKKEEEERLEQERIEAEERRRKEEEEEKKKRSTGNEELDRIIEEGDEYIEKLRKANVAIEHEGISESIDRMERAARDIFDFVKEHPSEIPEIKKFMNYYLPTTLKLLASYEKLSRQSVKGENIQGAMFDIEGMMQTIATAFEKQLDFLFSAEVMDLQADITVFESILEQEGLKDSEDKPKLKL